MRNTFLNSSKFFFESDFYKYHSDKDKQILIPLFKTGEFKFGKSKKNSSLKRKSNKYSKSQSRKKFRSKKIQWADRLKTKSVKKNVKCRPKCFSAKKPKLLLFKKLTKKKKRVTTVKTEQNESFEENKSSCKYFDVKKLERFLKKNLKSSQTSDSLKKNLDDLGVSSSTEFYKKNLRNLQKRIFSRNSEKQEGKNKNMSKASTNIQEESTNLDKSKKSCV